jgi:uncharacterized membrane protein
MKEKPLKDFLLVIGILTGFIFTISLAIFYSYTTLSQHNACMCYIPLSLIIIIVGSLGLFVGSLTYYFLLDRIVKRYKNQKTIKESLRPFMKLLEEDEAKVVELLLEKKKLSQASISKLAELSRVKTTRVLQKLEDKGIVKREKKGKTNIVELAEHIKKLVE